MKKVSPKNRTMGTMKRGLDVTEFAVDLTDEFDIDFDNKGLYEGSSLELNKVDPSSSNLGLLPL